MLNSKSNVNLKKELLKKIVNNYNFKSRQGMWFLNFLLDDKEEDRLDNRVHFVLDINDCEFSVEISTVGTPKDYPSFNCYVDNKLVTNTDDAFHLLRKNLSDHLYIKLNYLGCIFDDLYLINLEESPSEIKNNRSVYVCNREIEKLLNYLIEKNEKFLLMNRIDNALLIGDKDDFINCCEKYNNLIINKPTVKTRKDRTFFNV